MTLSNEWEEVYLTENGWVDGSYRHDFEETKYVEKPPNILMTVYRGVIKEAIMAKEKCREEITYHTDDKDRIIKALLRHGQPKFGL